MAIRPVGAKLFDEDDRSTDGQTDLTKLSHFAIL